MLCGVLHNVLHSRTAGWILSWSGILFLLHFGLVEKGPCFENASYCLLGDDSELQCLQEITLKVRSEGYDYRMVQAYQQISSSATISDCEK